jgi:hypothetical protein
MLHDQDRLMRIAGPEVRIERVGLVTFDERLDAVDHLRQCEAADLVAADNAAGRMGDGVFLRTLMTYPELRGVTGITRVYIAWKNRIRWWHQVNGVLQLEMNDLRSMDPRLATRMQLGAEYLWVFAKPEQIYPDLQRFSIPFQDTAFRYGLLARLLDRETVKWF